MRPLTPFPALPSLTQGPRGAGRAPSGLRANTCDYDKVSGLRAAWRGLAGSAWSSPGVLNRPGGPRVLNFVLCCSRQLGVAVAEAGHRPMQAAGSSLGPLRGYVQCHRVRVG